MSATVAATTDHLTESFPAKVLRKCAESMEMKEKFFAQNAASLDEMSRALAERFRRGENDGEIHFGYQA